MAELLKLRAEVFSALRWTAIARIATQVVAWTATIATARILTPQDYGLVALASLLIGYFVALADLGLGASLVRQLNVSKAEEATIDCMVLLIGLVAGLCVAASAGFVAPILGDIRAAPLSVVLALQCPLSAACVVPSAMLSRQMRFDVLSRIAVISGVIAAGVAISSALLGLGVWSLVMASTSDALVRSILLRGASQAWAIRLPKWALLVPYFTQSKWIVGERSLWYWYAQADTLIIGKMLGVDHLGMYNMAKQLGSIPVDKVLGPVNQVALPAIARMQGDSSDVAVACKKMIRLSLLFSLPVFWGLSVVAPTLIDVVLGEKWVASGMIMAVVCLALPFRVLGALLGTALTAVGRPDVSFRNMLIASAVVPLAVAFGAQWGVLAAAAGWALSVPLVATLLVARAASVLGFRWFAVFWAARVPFLAAASMVGVVGVQQYWCANSWSSGAALAGGIGIGALVYLAMLGMLDRKIFSEAIAFGRGILGR